MRHILGAARVCGLAVSGPSAAAALLVQERQRPREGGIAMAFLFLRLSVLGLVAILGMVSRVEAFLLPIVTTNDLKKQITAAQTSINQIPPAWSQNLPAAKRFELVLGGAAVLDHGLGSCGRRHRGIRTEIRTSMIRIR